MSSPRRTPSPIMFWIYLGFITAVLAFCLAMGFGSW